MRATRKAVAEGINFGKVCTAKSDTLEFSEGNGKVRKRVKRDFGEKRL